MSLLAEPTETTWGDVKDQNEAKYKKMVARIDQREDSITRLFAGQLLNRNQGEKELDFDLNGLNVI